MVFVVFLAHYTIYTDIYINNISLLTVFEVNLINSERSTKLLYDKPRPKAGRTVNISVDIKAKRQVSYTEKLFVKPGPQPVQGVQNFVSVNCM